MAQVVALCSFHFQGVVDVNVVPFNRIRPLVLGLPLSMAWIVAWVVMSGIALFLLDRSEARGRKGADGVDTGPSHPGGE